MSKIAGLQAAHELLTISRTNCARHFLLGFTPHPDDGPHELRLVAASLLLVEIEDHLHNLTGITEACRHSLAGTAPDECWPPESFDPYAVIAEHLGDEHRLPVGRLSPALLGWLDARPEQERRTAAKLLELFGPDSGLLAHVTDADGRVRPATAAERQQAPERSLLASIEQTAFTLTYAADLAEAAHLAAARAAAPGQAAALSRILSLVQ